jgi:hypothetical protein
MKVMNYAILKWLVDPSTICKTYMLEFFKSAFASVCLRLEGFNFFCIPVPRHIEEMSFRVVPLRPARQTSGKRSSCGSKSSRVFSQVARHKNILSVQYHNVYS